VNELHLFAGAGGGILGGQLLGHTCVCAVELEPYCRRVLLQRQRDGCLPKFPIWDDVRTFDGRPWRGLVDVVCGGFPCQDISAAGRGEGITGERSGLWREMARIVGEVRPRYVFVENSPVLTSRGLGVVLGDLAAMGFDARWGVLGADDAGAPHIRKRIWILAHTQHDRLSVGRRDADSCSCRPERIGVSGHDASGGGVEASSVVASPPQERQRTWRTRGLDSGGAGESELALHDVPNADGAGCREQRRTIAGEPEHAAAEQRGWWSVEPALGRVAHGVADRVDRLAAIGNGQVPAVAALAWRTLMNKEQP